MAVNDWGSLEVRRPERTFDGRGIELALRHRHTLHHRLGDDGMAPSRRIAIRADLNGKVVANHRTVPSAGHVVFAVPNQFHRAETADLFGDQGAFDDIFCRGARPPTKGSAGEQGFDLYGTGQNAERHGDGGLVHGRTLAAIGQLDLLTIDLRDTVHRLHRRVRQIGEIEPELDQVAVKACGDITMHIKGLGAFACCRDLLIFLDDLGRTALFRLRIVPSHLKGVAALLGGPSVFGDHGDA